MGIMHNAILQNAMALQEYNYTVHDIAGKNNVAADYFSLVMN